MNKPTKYEVIIDHFNFISEYLKDDTDMITRLGELVVDNQVKYNPTLTLERAKQAVINTIKKREVAHALLVAISLDNFATMNMLPEPLQSIVFEDSEDFGTDEDLMSPAMHLYGSIGWTNAGYLDKLKPGIIGEVDKVGKNDPELVTTFLDDQLGVIVAVSAAKIASDAQKNKKHDN